MIILATLTGIMVGCGVNWASDSLPKLAHKDRPAVGRPVSGRVPGIFLPVLRRLSIEAVDWSWLDVIVPLVCGIVFTYWGLRYGFSMKAAGLSGMSTFLLLVALIDLKYRLILNVMIYPALVLILVFRLVIFPQERLSTILGGILAFSIFFITALIRPGDLGGGDIKLAALFGVGFGFPSVLWVLLVGALSGGVGAMIIFIRQSAPKHIAYAPYLCFGALIALIHLPF